MTDLAIDGGEPVRKISLPYGRQWIDDKDLDSVVEILRSDWLTTGPTVGEFEKAFAAAVGSWDAVAVSSGTAALHTAAFAANIQTGDEVIIPAMTFAATANCVVYQGGHPVFADVSPDTLLIDPEKVEALITPRTRAIIAVDYTGQPCSYETLCAIAEKHSLLLIDDAAHALGGSYKGQAVGTLADINTFSLHPVKHITTGEGGVITTNDSDLATRMRLFRSHGITTDHRQREQSGSWFYEMTDLGYNYRLTDFQCALGLSQLRKLRENVVRRQQIAQHYNEALANLPGIQPLTTLADVSHPYHLYVVQLDLAQFEVDRAKVFAALRAEGIGVNVHYIPVHLHPYYQQRFGTGYGLCPVAEQAYERIISLPVFPQMSAGDIGDVIEALKKVNKAYRR